MIRWLYPGMHIKRWLALMLIGIVVIGLGFGYVLREVYEGFAFPDFVFFLTLQFWPRYIRAILFGGAGVLLVGYGFYRLNRSLVESIVPAGDERSVVERVFRYRQRERGPKIVAVGGGTGLSTLLRGLKQHTSNITAILTVADDGGSSGRLRRELGVLPPGDFRNCLAALADAEPLVTELFQYRFGEGSGLEGHSFGNLFIVAMSGVTGNFEQAIKESGRVLAVRGRILPSTVENVTLVAETEGDETVEGESRISATDRRIKRVYLNPENPPAYPEAVQALLEADFIVLGPGSLYTSIMPNLLVGEIADGVRRSPAAKLYVCNVATQPGETDGFSVEDHVAVIEQHVGPGLFRSVLVNTKDDAVFPDRWRVAPVRRPSMEDVPSGIRYVHADVVNYGNRLRHDPAKLATAVMKILIDRGQPKEPEPERDFTKVAVG